MNQRGLFKAKTITRLTGFSPALLRAWETRHALVHPSRTPGGQRLYSQDDLHVLQNVRTLLEGGRSIGEIARLGRETLLSEGIRRPTPAPAGNSELGSRLDTLREQIVQAAARLDGAGLNRALDEAFALVSAEQVLREVVEPAAHAIGEWWAAGRCSVAGEHLASAAFASRLQKLIDARHRGSDSRADVVCACLPDEQHVIGLMSLTFHLLGQGFRVVSLGAGLPFEDLDRACKLLRPRAVCLSVARPALLQVHRTALLDFLRRHEGAMLVYLGGAGGAQGDFEAAGARVWPLERSCEEFVQELRHQFGEPA